MSKMKLYHWKSFKSAKVIFVIKELGVMDDFEIIRLNSHEPDTKAMQEYRKTVHPHGTIPALVIEGETTMLESTAICLFLTDKYGKLLPEAKYKHEHYDWIIYCTVTMEQVLHVIWEQWIWRPQKHDEATMKSTTDKWKVCLDYLTTTLSNGREYICGCSFTLADCILGYALDWAESMRDGILLKGHPRVAEYFDRIKKRPAFEESMRYE